MISYRLYFFSADGRISHATTLDCDGDESAILACEAERTPSKMELWERGRLVKVFAASPAEPGER